MVKIPIIGLILNGELAIDELFYVILRCIGPPFSFT